MIAVNFPEANITFGPPPGVSDSQVVPIRAFAGTSQGCSMDGVPVVVTAWKPAAHELAMLNAGHPIFLTVVGAGLPPHMMTTNFQRGYFPQMIPERSTVFNQIALALQGMRDGWSTLEFNVQCAQIILTTGPACAVEIGVYGGRTTVAIGLAMKALGKGVVHAIDPWDPASSVEGQVNPDDREWWGKLDHERIYRGCLTAIDTWGIKSHVMVHRARSDDVTPPADIGLLIVDGNHGPQSIRDVARFAPSVPVGGWAYLDDLDWSGGAVRHAERNLLAMGFEFAFARDKGAFFRRISKPTIE